MELDGVHKVETADFYIDLAFRQATKAGDVARETKISGTRLDKSRKIEIAKVKAIKDAIANAMSDLIKSFPDMDSLTEFYKQLFKIFLDKKQMKRSLGGLNWLREKAILFGNQYMAKIKKCENLSSINKYRKEFYGRISSLVKRVEKDLKYLEQARRTMKKFPSVKSMFTVCIAGFPNVGKSTLLSKLTTAKPEIKDYAFTTKGLNTGYMKHAYLKIQFIDTPGTLNRKDKMNEIEMQADLAMKYCADVIIFIFDPTETYSYKDQVKLLERTKRLMKPIYIYISKTDVADETAVDKLIAANEKRKIPVYLETKDLTEEMLKLCRENL